MKADNNAILQQEQAVKVCKHQVLIGIELGAEFDILVNALRCLLQRALIHRSGDQYIVPILL